MRKEQLQLLGVWIGIILTILLLSSCKVTEQKATQYLSNHRELAAKYCSETFPPRDCVVIRTNTVLDTMYMPEIIIDSVVYCDSVVQGKPAKEVHIQCPPATVITKTVTKDSIVFQRNTAEEERLKITISNQWLEKQSLIAKADEAKSKLKHRNKLILWLLLVIAGETIYIFRKPIMELVMRLILPIKNIYPF